MSKKTPENLVKDEIKDYLNLKGWFHFPVMQGMGSYHGIPDRIAVKDGVVLFIEVKSPSGKLTEHQRAFCDKIEDHRGYYLVVRGYEDIERWEEDYRGSY